MSDRSNSGAAGGIGLVTVLIALIFLFIWPGVLRYEYREPASAKTDTELAVVKIDRYTHQIWHYNWQSRRWDKR